MSLTPEMDSKHWSVLAKSVNADFVPSLIDTARKRDISKVLIQLYSLSSTIGNLFLREIKQQNNWPRNLMLWFKRQS